MATIQHAFRRMGVPRLPRRRKRPPRPKQLRQFEKPHPGDSVQIDVKVVTVKARKCFQYTALGVAPVWWRVKGFRTRYAW
jgi:hypothetical protein